MDVQAYKLASPVRVRFPGTETLVELRPLAQAELEEASRAAGAWCAASGAPLASALGALELSAQAVARALGVDPEELRGQAELDELLELERARGEVQERAMPDVAALREELRRAVCSDPEVLLDGVSAFCARGASDYYGRPMVDLTVGQVVYFTFLRRAYEEFHVEGAASSGNRTKYVSKRWLETKNRG